MAFRALLEQCEEVESLEKLFSLERYVWLTLNYDMAAVLDMDGCFTDINSNWERTTGHPVSDIKDHYLLEFMHFEDREKNLAGLQQLITSDIATLNLDFRFLCQGGAYKRTHWNVAFSPYHDLYFCVVKDVSGSRIENPMHAAYHDALTGLPNRLYLADHFPDILVRAKDEQCLAAMLFLDLDHFKDANDAYGHRFGDELLKEVSRRLRETVRDVDSVVRLGGDEFVIVLPNIRERKQVEDVARRIIASINSPCRIDGNDASLGASIGASIFPEHGDNVDELIQKADQAMYKVKRQGKNDFLFFEEPF